MKKLNYLFLALFISFSFFSCSSDDDGNNDSTSNFLKVGNKEYTLKAGLLEDYGSFSTGVYNFDVTLITSTLTTVAGEVLPQDEIYSGIYFELFTANENNLEEGVYNFSTSNEANTFEYADIGIDVSIDQQETVEGFQITGGSFEVLDNGNSYHLKFQGETDSGENFSGEYKGSLTKFDESWGKEINTAKKNLFFKK